MKKKYTVFAIKVVGFMLVLFCFSVAILTYNEALNIKDTYIGICNNLDNLSTIYYSIEDESIDDIVKTSYANIGSGYVSDEEIGFYCEVKDYKGKVLAHSQNYITVTKDDGDMRVVLLKDVFPQGAEAEEFDDYKIANFWIDGVCDDTYIYPNKIIWSSYDAENYELTFDDTDKQANLATTSFKDWIGDDDYQISINYMGAWWGNDAKKQARNDEAKKISKKIYGDDVFIYDDEYYDLSSEGIFTTYVSHKIYLNESAVMSNVYVFHPVAIAMSELVDIYLIFLVVAIIMIFIISKLVKKMYTQQREFELRTRKMTRGVAHELKTPLAITKTYVENWQYIDEEDRDDYCKNMVDEIDHMNMLVNDLLELSRMECGAKKLQKEAVDILALTNTINAHMKGMIDERNLEINIITDKNEQEYLVNADLEMMRIVINNFISNAVKYADKKISVYLSKAGKKITFKIENDGQGISKQDIDRVWDTFYKTDDSRSNRIGSSGLGLAITKNILILHEAEYGCSSEQGKTTFWFKLKKMEE